jgi:hypothetical protein
MPSYCNYQYMFPGTNRESAGCIYFDALIRISSQNKYHLHSRHLASYLVYGAQKTFFGRDFRNQLLKHGHSG